MKVVDKVWVWRQRDALCLVSWARTNSFDDPYLIPVRFVKGQQNREVWRGDKDVHLGGPLFGSFSFELSFSDSGSDLGDLQGYEVVLLPVIFFGSTISVVHD